MATFTKACVYTCDTQAHFQNWGLAFGQAFTALGWIPQSGHGEIVNNYSGGSNTGTNYTWSNSNKVQTTTQRTITPQQFWNFRSTWVSGTTYTGVMTTINQANVDVVLSPIDGNTYAHVTSTSSAATDPSADDTNWMPFNYEIFKSNGPMSSSVPLYIRIAYGVSTTSNQPLFLVSCGTGIDSSGNVTGNIPLTNTSPTTCKSCNAAATAATASTFDCDFSGDADNIRFSMWKTHATLGMAGLILWDRAKTASGTDSDAYVYHCNLQGTASTSPPPWSVVALKNSLGGNISQFTTSFGGVVYFGSNSQSLSNFGGITPLPVFPLVGYLGNPVLGVMCFSKLDVSEGNLVPVWMYGASHNYLVMGNLNLGANSGPISGSTMYMGFLWE